MKRVVNRASSLPAMLLFLLGLFCIKTEASTVIVPGDDDQIVGARGIVRGKVLSVNTGLDQNLNIVCTYITLKVQEVLKGNISTDTIVLKEPGGAMADRGTVIEGTPVFNVGERVIVYLESWPDGALRVHDLFLGKFSVTMDPATGLLFAERAMPGGTLQGTVAPDPSQSYTSRMELGSYLKMVRQHVALDQTRSNAFENRYYPGVPVLTEPLEYRAQKASGGLQEQFHLFNPPARHFEPDSNQPVVYVIDPDNEPNPQAADDVRAAAAAWSSVPGCALRVSVSGNVSGCQAGGNVVDFNNCQGFFSADAGPCQNILAEGGFNYGGQSEVVNGTTFRIISTAFVSINPFAACFASEHCQLQEILTHEMGHSLGLHHSWDPIFGGTATPAESIATMFYIAHFDGRCASIKDDDMAGITFVYPAGSSTPPPGLSVTTTSLPNASPTSAYSQTLAASGGTPPYTWSLAGGSLPTGLSLSSAGVISGTSTVIGTASFTVHVADTASHTAQASLSITTATASGSGFDAHFVNQSVPSTVTPGAHFSGVLTFLNSGSQPWNDSTTTVLASQNPPLNFTWGGQDVTFSGFNISPGGQAAFTVTFIAPTVPGTYDFQWQMYVVSTSSFFGDLSTDVKITVGQPQPISITTSSLPSGLLGAPYDQGLLATGGSGPYSWSIASGSLPAGLSLNAATGHISGSCQGVGTFNFAVTAVDTAGLSAARQFSIQITGPVLAINALTFQQALVGSAYDQVMTASGGTPPYTWSVGSGFLPAGLQLIQNTGHVSGTPAQPGTFAFVVVVTDNMGNFAQRSMSIAVVQPLAITTVSLPAAVMGSTFNQQLTGSGGVAPYTWGIQAGSLPTGLGLNPATGAITGTPTAAGAFGFTVFVRDQAQATATRGFQVQIVSPSAVPHVSKLKYKAGGQKLVISGINFDPAAVVMVDGIVVGGVVEDSADIVVKHLPLGTGAHSVVVMNPGGIISETATVTAP